MSKAPVSTTQNTIPLLDRSAGSEENAIAGLGGVHVPLSEDSIGRSLSGINSSCLSLIDSTRFLLDEALDFIAANPKPRRAQDNLMIT